MNTTTATDPATDRIAAIAQADRLAHHRALLREVPRLLDGITRGYITGNTAPDSPDGLVAYRDAYLKLHLDMEIAGMEYGDCSQCRNEERLAGGLCYRCI